MHPMKNKPQFKILKHLQTTAWQGPRSTMHQMLNRHFFFMRV